MVTSLEKLNLNDFQQRVYSRTSVKGQLVVPLKLAGNGLQNSQLLDGYKIIIELKGSFFLEDSIDGLEETGTKQIRYMSWVEAAMVMFCPRMSRGTACFFTVLVGSEQFGEYVKRSKVYAEPFVVS